ncbi:Alpha-latrotoxin-Lt1a [Drechslerella dactyloides]|uniref:Alpha-latrotoxin-Lt1a n=1 Tax=Drechslerella dactyloides TaxID=74499 RepID=A0AAD6J2Z7_DREDA|nr:Alpha-latrotoxin-Lt1a [Drechslerella dactyloides]
MDDPVPLYEDAQGGSLESDLRRIAEGSNGANTTTPHHHRHHDHHHDRPQLHLERAATIVAAALASAATTPTAHSDDPDTDDLIRRLLREDAEEAADSEPAPAAAAVPPANIIKTFFDAIKNENSELISAFIDSGLVKVGSKNADGVTPLVAAVRANHVRVVQQLVDYGADVNQFSTEADPESEHRLTYRNGKAVKDHYDVIQRTPLMVAAENGHMPLVKLFFDVFHARDDIVPSDGMTALRLAAQNGHRDIVEFLPTRRLGGLQRWKYRNRASVRRAKRLLRDIYKFLKAIFFDLPKFFVWTIPKHVVVLPVYNGSKYVWVHRKDIAEGIKDGVVNTGKAIKNGTVKTGKAIKNGVVKTGKTIARVSKRAAIKTAHAIQAIPSVTVKAAKATGRGIVNGAKWTWKFFFVYLPRALIRLSKATGRAIVRLVKATGRATVITVQAIWKFFTVQLPKAIVWFVKATLRFIKATAIWIKDATVATAKAVKDAVVWIVKQVWKTLTVRIPNAIVAIVKWLFDAVKYTAGKVADLIIRIASAFHTLLTKLVNWFAGITWTDVLNGFVDVIKWIFVEIPKMIWDGVVATGKMIKKVLEALFGWVGSAIYYTGYWLLWLVTYVPQKLFALMVELFETIGRGVQEVAVWINPKKI